MKKALTHVVAGVVLALAGSLLVQAPPAQASHYDWSTVYETRRHVKAQMCKFRQGGKGVRYRANARQARLGGRAYFQVKVLRYGWVMKVGSKYAYPGRVSSWGSDTGFRGGLKVRARIKTRNGTSLWGRWRPWRNLRHC